jgi:hypothetical protein
MAPPVVPTPARRLNFLGLPAPAREPIEVFAALGLEVNGFFPEGASLDHWRSISQAAVTFVVDRTMFPRLARRLGGYGQEVVDTQLPVGIEATENFYRHVAQTFDCTPRLDAVLGARLGAARAQAATFREAYGGVKLGMAIRMLNTYQVDRLVQDGMGDVSHLRELGFDVHLFIQGPLEEGPRFEARLRDKGVDLPVQAFPGPWRLADYLREAQCQVCYVPDSSRNLVRRAGIPMISSRSLHPWLSGVKHNLAVLSDLVLQARSMGRAP